MRIVLLGAGLIGFAMALDLSRDKEIKLTVVDIDNIPLLKLKEQHGISVIRSDLNIEKNVRDIVKDYDIVLNAVPGFMGYNTLKYIIEAGKDVVDISFFAEDPFSLDKLAKDQDIMAIVDCGVAPGMSNMLTGYVNEILDKTEMGITYVGGLPEVREKPFEYKAVFSPVDVIEEYTRPARFIENGELVVKKALSDPEYLFFENIGTLEAFNSDGLRTLAETIEAPNLKEKTLRYPGHIEKITLLRDIGFFNKDKIDINGVKIRPMDLTAKLLFPKWKLEYGEVDLTIMQVIVEGIKDKKKLRYTFNLLDRADTVNGIHSMARTTGYTATSVIRMIKKGLFRQNGIIPPEFIGKESICMKYVLNDLKDRGVVYKERIEEID